MAIYTIIQDSRIYTLYCTDGSDFVVVINKTLVFPPGFVNTRIKCEDIIIIGDTVPEPVELFTYTLTPVHPLDTIMGPRSVSVIIQNDDPSKLWSYIYTRYTLLQYVYMLHDIVVVCTYM